MTSPLGKITASDYLESLSITKKIACFFCNGVKGMSEEESLFSLVRKAFITFLSNPWRWQDFNKGYLATIVLEIHLSLCPLNSHPTRFELVSTPNLSWQTHSVLIDCNCSLTVNNLIGQRCNRCWRSLRSPLINTIVTTYVVFDISSFPTKFIFIEYSALKT